MPRRGVPANEKQALRAYYRRQHPRPSQRALRQWFQATYNRPISQSTVSECLSDHYSYLDDLDPTSFHSQFTLQSQRQRSARWPTLENLLYEWHQTIEKKGGIITGDLLVAKAHQIWQQLPEYADQEIPELSDRWLGRFKKRFHIKQRVQHGEAASVPESAEAEMRAVRTLCGDYQEDDIYNMDETGLFWRQSPSIGLTSQIQPGRKKDKTRITLTICTNYTGSDRFPIWFIGKAQVPHALRGVNFTAMGAVWRANKKAWMNQFIMKEWLDHFYRHIGTTRHVLLLMDNFKSHSAGLQLNPPPPNIRIQWLPANATSKFQPLDQGIIQNLKIHYKRQWLRFMIYHYEQDNDPIKRMNLFHTCSWLIRAWNDDVSNTTIYNCFRKSSILQAEPIELPTEPAPDLRPLYNQVRTIGSIQDAMDLSRFLHPPDEDEDKEDNDMDGDPLQVIIDSHLGNINENIDPELDDEGPGTDLDEVLPVEALRGIQIALQFHLRQDDADVKETRVLQRLERSFQLKAQPNAQGSLDDWLIR